jgi:transcriptional regulator with XRE-family HTH domain
MNESRHIPEDFFDVEYLYAYAEDFLNTKIATQIRVLREQRGLTQEELAQKIGTKQPGIARLENVNYSAWKVETLKKLAPALGVIFVCGFVSLRTFLDETEKFGRKLLEQPSLDEEIAALTENMNTTCSTEAARAKTQTSIVEHTRGAQNSIAVSTNGREITEASVLFAGAGISVSNLTPTSYGIPPIDSPSNNQAKIFFSYNYDRVIDMANSPLKIIPQTMPVTSGTPSSILQQPVSAGALDMHGPLAA